MSRTGATGARADAAEACRAQPLLAHLLPARAAAGERRLRLGPDLSRARVRAARGPGGAADRQPRQPDARGAAGERRHQPRGADQERVQARVGPGRAARTQGQVGALRSRPAVARDRRGTARAARRRHPRRQLDERQPGPVGRVLDRPRSVLAADRPRARRADVVEHAEPVGRHRPAGHGARLGGHRPPDQPAAEGAVVRRDPHRRRRVRFAPGRDHHDQRDPPGQHGLQPDGARARQGRAGPGGHAGRHLARPAHAAGAAAPGSRDERAGRGGQGQHGPGHRPARRHHRQVHGLRPPRRGQAGAGEPAGRGRARDGGLPRYQPDPHPLAGRDRT